MNISKITLGTAQLGMDYGIANVTGKPDFETSLEILKYAYESGITVFDTSPYYKESESIIGSFISSYKPKNLTIISKLPRIKDIEKKSYEQLLTYVKDQVDKSLTKLNIEKLDIYLLHVQKGTFNKNGLVECLIELKREGLIDQIGVSVYNPEEVEKCLKLNDITVIEVPINVFDHRLIRTGLFKELKRRNYTIFARSVYLQGLFFLSPYHLPERLKEAKISLLELHDLSEKYNIDVDKIALLFVNMISELDSFVIGVENIEQIVRNLEIIQNKILQKEVYERILDDFFDIPEKIINPSLWKGEWEI